MGASDNTRVSRSRGIGAGVSDVGRSRGRAWDRQSKGGHTPGVGRGRQGARCVGAQETGPGRGEMEGVGHGLADPAECVVSPAVGRTGKRW